MCFASLRDRSKVRGERSEPHDLVIIIIVIVILMFLLCCYYCLILFTLVFSIVYYLLLLFSRQFEKVGVSVRRLKKVEEG